MLYRSVIGILFALTLTSPSAVFSKDRTRKSPTALSADEVAIYQALLRHYVSDEPGPTLNVSMKTYPLDPESHMNGLRSGECLKDVHLDNLPRASSMYHELPPEVLPGKNMRLVDPNKQAKIVKRNDPGRTIAKGKAVHDAVGEAFVSGLFSMSEIAFDKEHHYAVVTYTFWCGSLCGNGSIVVFENVGGGWKDTQRHCSSWIS